MEAGRWRLGDGRWRLGAGGWALEAGLASLGQGDDNLHIVDGEEARIPVDHALIPVLIDLVGEDDGVALLEAKLALVLGLEVVQTPTAGLVQHL